MPRTLHVAILALLLVVGVVGSAFSREDPATCTRVIDGDTIEVRVGGRIEKVRLIGAEIIRQAYGFAYTKYPFSLMEEFRDLQWQAREEGLGLWAENQAD